MSAPPIYDDVGDVGNLSDLTIKVGDVNFPIERMMLLKTSEYFFEMFRDYPFNKIKELVITDFDKETVRNYIRFVYDEELSSWSEYNVSLFKMACQYSNQSLENQCKEVLKISLEEGDIKREDIAELWDFVEKAGNKFLLRHVWCYFAKRWGGWCNTPSRNFTGLDELLKRNPMYKHNFCVFISENECYQLS